jgi:hypothetical protein
LAALPPLAATARRARQAQGHARGAGESYSDVILRLAKGETGD